MMLTNRFTFTAAAILFSTLCHSIPAQGEEEETLGKILEKHRLATFVEVGEYVKSHPEAEDVNDAYFHLFREGLTQNMEKEAMPFAELYLKRQEQLPPLSTLAQRIRCMGMAASGDYDEAYIVYEGLLAEANPQSADAMLGLGFTLACKARGANKPGVSRDIFERLSATFPFNRKVSSIVQASLMKQDLLDKPAPELGVPDIDGKEINWEQYKGKVVLVDFWATWCGPCLQEMPNIKQVYEDFHEDGFEIIGISRDDDAETVKKFLEKAELPWRQVMSDGEEVKLAERFEVSSIPATFLVDRKGNLVQFDVRGREIRLQVEKLLKQ